MLIHTLNCVKVQQADNPRDVLGPLDAPPALCNVAGPLHNPLGIARAACLGHATIAPVRSGGDTGTLWMPGAWDDETGETWTCRRREMVEGAKYMCVCEGKRLEGQKGTRKGPCACARERSRET